jgi:hypothetical protein
MRPGFAAQQGVAENDHELNQAIFGGRREPLAYLNP